MIKPLSPAAQAVIHEYSKIAYDNNVGISFTPLPWEQKAIAGALRAAADQVVPDIGYEADCLDEPVESELQCIRNRFLAIANELENIDD